MKDQLTISSEVDTETRLFAGLWSVEHYVLERRALMTEVKPSNPLFGATHPGRSVTGVPVARGKAAFAPPSASPFKRAVMLE